jgi:SAM-dependent methyltransferase
MPDPTFGPLRLYDASRDLAARAPAPPGYEAPGLAEPSLLALARELAARETMRPSYVQRGDTEPLSLPWYLSLEQARHHRQGRWLPRLLEFGKHQGEKLLGLGCGLGSDLVRYAAAGAEVISVSGCLEQLALVRRNFELRGLPGSFLHASPRSLPVESASIDVVCVTGLLHEADDPAPLIAEVYRVLKPGGKLLAVVPAHYDIEYWSRVFLLGSRGLEPNLLGTPGRRFKSRGLRQLLERFLECRVWKRHLRRGDVPHLWRWVPLSLLERLAGRLLVFKGFKPVSAAKMEQAAA